MFFVHNDLAFVDSTYTTSFSNSTSSVDQIFETYRAAPEVTRRRLYIETLRDVLERADKVIIDEGADGGQGVVPYLPLNELNRNRSANSGELQ